VCRGKAKGSLVLFTQDVKAATEIRASQAELVCLRDMLTGDACDDCAPVIRARIVQITKYRDSFK
jgi:hypothetical protein